MLAKNKQIQLGKAAMEQAVFDFINQRPLQRVTAQSVLQKGRAEVLRFTGDALLLYMKEGLHILCADSDGAALHIMEGVEDCALMVNERTGADEAIMRRYGFHSRGLCYNVVYPHKTPIALDTEVYLDRIPLSELGLVTRHYTLLDPNEVETHIRGGSLLGGYLGQEMVGFIGQHTEQSMGMLYIFPQYRLRGYGYTLEALLINRILQRGEVPYGQVYVDNHASLSLQEKLGMVRSEDVVSWLHG